ncbi:MAG: hypothetical protein J6R00_10355 [Lentisphaeria bacterium]|nr:hypothetical protein [Lentisphaeria bacterium]
MNNEDWHANRSEEEWELEIRRDEKRINRYFHELPVCIDLPEEEEFIFSDISSIPELIPQNSSADELRRICRPDDDSDDDMHDGAHGDDENVCSVNDMAVDWAMLCVEKLCGELWNAGVGISCDFGKLIARIEEFNTSAENSDKNLSKSVGKRMLRDLGTLILHLSDLSRYQCGIKEDCDGFIEKLNNLRFVLKKRIEEVVV